MKKLLTILTKINLKISTIIIITLAILSGRYRPLFIHLLIAFIHELGHGVMAYSLNIRISKLNVLPFGFYLEIDNLEHIHIFKEFLIVLFGPLMYVVNLFLLQTMFTYNLISHQLYQQGLNANIVILIFNLLPIYPLDGHRLLTIITSPFITYKKMKILNLIFSIISLITLLILAYQSANIIVYFYLLYMQIYYLIHFKEYYLSFLVSRMNNRIYKKAKINTKNDFYRPYNNIFLHKKNLLSEKEFALKILKNGLK